MSMLWVSLLSPQSLAAMVIQIMVVIACVQLWLLHHAQKSIGFHDAGGTERVSVQFQKEHHMVGRNRQLIFLEVLYLN